MNRMKHCAAIAAVALLLAACSNEKEAAADAQAVTFVTTIGTTVASSRISGTAWESTDRVGIYMSKSDKSGYELYDANVCYNPNGTPAPDTANGGYTLCFPSDGIAEFFAYYPYTTTFTDPYTPTFDFDFQQQSKLTDVYTAKQPLATNTDIKVQLKFTHALTKVQFTLTSPSMPTDADLSKCKLAISNQPTKATMALQGNKSLNPVWTTTATGNVTAVKSENANIYTAMLRPDDAASAKTIVLSLYDANSKYIGDCTATVPSVQWSANNLYTYNLTLSRTTLAITPLTSIIGWGTESYLH